MKRKVIHLYHYGETEGSGFDIVHEIEEFDGREEVRNLLIEKFREILNFILRLR